MKKQAASSKMGLYIAYRDLDHRWSKIGVTGDSFERRFVTKNQGEPVYYRVKKYTLLRLPRKDALAIEKHVVDNFVTKREDKEWVRLPAKELFTVVAGVINNDFPQHISALNKARDELGQSQKEDVSKPRKKGRMRAFVTKSDPVRRRIFDALYKKINSLAPDIEVFEGQQYFAYKKDDKNFAYLRACPDLNLVRLSLKLEPKKEKLDGKTIKKGNIGGGGKILMELASEDDLGKAFDLIEKAYRER